MSDVRLIIVPYDSGIRGWRMGAGPLDLRSNLEDRLRACGHAVQTQWIAAPGGPPDTEIRTNFHLAAGVADAVRDARSAYALPVILSGNCSTSIGTLAGLADAEPAVVWLDAHGDFNTPETSPSGFLDGMSLAAATGRCWAHMASAIPGFRAIPESRVLLVGTRDLDPAEADLLRASACTVLPPHELDARLSDTLDTLRTRAGTVYLHIDLDVLDPSEATANAFAAPDGLRLSQVVGIVREIRSRFDLAAVALTAYDPYYDPDARIVSAAEAVLTELVNDA
jgi:arginase